MISYQRKTIIVNNKEIKFMNSLIPKHAGYRNLKTFQLARLIFDITVRFCNRFIDKKSRTQDQSCSLWSPKYR